MKVYLKNRQRLIRPDQKKIRSLLRKALRLLCLSKAELSILFVNDRRMRLLNRQYRGIDRTTDVLSFPQTEGSTIHSSRFTNQGFVLGDIVINVHKAKRQAAEYGHSFHQEMKKLMVHGLLHLIGFDHEKGGYGEKQMRRKEKELLRSL